MTDARSQTEPDADVLAERGREVVLALADGRFEETVTYRSPDDENGPEVLPDAWAEVTGIFGEFRGVESVEADPDEGTATVRFALSGGRFRADLRFEDGALVDCPLKKVDSTSRLGAVATAARVVRHLAGKAAGRLRPGGDADAAGGDADAAGGNADAAGETATTPAERKRVVRATLEDLAAAEYDDAAARLSDDLRADLGPTELAAAWDRHGCADPSPDRIADDPEAGVAYADFHNGTKEVRLRLHFADGAVSGLTLVPPQEADAADYEPPAYADDAAFEERDVDAGVDGRRSGTLALPAGDDPTPGVVLVHGSGPSDRDGTAGGVRLQQDLAWGLASRGVAVLRYGKPVLAGDDADADARTVDDAVAAVEQLAARESIGDVYVLAHSLGGLLLPRVLARADAAGGVALAAPSRPLADLLVYQTDRLLDADPDPDRRAELEAMRSLADRVADGDVPEDTAALGFPASFWRDLDGYDPTEAVADLDTPMFVAHAGRDWRVPDADFARWRDAVGPARTRRYPELDHALAYADAERTSPDRDAANVARAVVADLAAWIHARDGDADHPVV